MVRPYNMRKGFSKCEKKMPETNLETAESSAVSMAKSCGSSGVLGFVVSADSCLLLLRYKKGLRVGEHWTVHQRKSLFVRV